MTKNAKKRKVQVSASLKRRLFAAISLLIVSTVMLVSTTYAWYTISTAPEANSIGTSVSGNGSLEVALMPSNGNIGAITSGRGDSGYYGGGSKAVTVSNTTWGNLVSLMDPSYGIDKITLKPITMSINQTGAISFETPEFGPDGRIKGTVSGSENLKSYNASDDKFNGTNYGVRAITETSGEEITPFGFAIDLALRINTTTARLENGNPVPAKLKLSNQGLQRYSSSNSESTLGEGTYVTLSGELGNISSGLKIVFIQNFGVSGDAERTVLATARLGTGVPVYEGDTQTNLLYTKYPLVLYNANNEEVTDLCSMTKNTTYQISAVVYLDGANATNADFAVSGEGTININLQFTTDATLTPMSVNDELPAGDGKTVIQYAINTLLGRYQNILSSIPAANRTAETNSFIAKYEEVSTALAGDTYDAFTYDQGNAIYKELQDLAAAAQKP